MADGTIRKDKLAKLIDAVSKEYAVYGPRAHGDVIAFRRIGSAEELMLDYRNSTMSPKDLFLPRTEVIYEFDGQNFVDEAMPDQKRVVIGMRPCDCRALTILDRVFDTDQVQDPFYVTRRANTVVVALGCNRPLSTCFCTALGGDPFSEEGADILLGDVGDSLLAKALTPKGKEFLAGYKQFFSKKNAGDWKDEAKKARNKLNTDLKLKGAESRLKELFEHDIWEAVSRKCNGCGACSYLCPTCYCFDLTDEKTATGVKKIRRWDCCMFSSFTLHASSHNPRPVTAARLRQRIMHKFSYYPESYGVSSCVGCGRCVRSCPVNLDIREALAEVMAAPEAAVEK
jgi:ferredoxin